jgi:hypothetical protein
VTKRHVFILAALLMLGGVSLAAYKIAWLGFPLSPGTRSAFWDIEIRVGFNAQGKPVKAALYVPRTTRRFAVLNENFISRGYGLTTATVDANRQAIWSIRRASGAQSLYYRAVVQKLDETELEFNVSEPHLPEVQPFEGSDLAAAEALMSEVREHSADLDTLVTQLLRRFARPEADPNVVSLLGGHTDPINKIETAIRVLRFANIHVRMVHGVRLEVERRRADLVPWLQVYNEAHWSYYNPETGEQSLPNDFLIVWRGDEEILKVKGADNPEFNITVRPAETETMEAARALGRALSPRLLDYSLLSLPIQTQSVYKILLTVPIGALLLVIMRNLIGVKTFGTFMPVLVALAFRETRLIWGVVLFTTIVAAGLIIRFYLERLKLLVVPRLAAVLVVVVLLMAFISILSHHFELDPGLSVALFPMVILTMTIERMCIVWEERGSLEALQQGIGSLAVAALAYLLMSNNYVEHVMFVFPELLLVLLGIVLLIGKYSGYRVTELRRFRAMRQAKP